MISLECIGPVSVTVDGGVPPPELMWRKHLALLVYLARSPRGRTRDHLVGLLWPEKAESKARHSLNEALRVLRRTVGEDNLTTDGETVRLLPGAVRVDRDDIPRANIRGVFLEGFSVPDAPAFEDWLISEREQCRLAVLRHLDAVAVEALGRGSLAVARDSSLRALEVEPRHEPAARTLMRAHALEGARTLALQTYARLTAVLERDLGLAPDPETTALAERIRHEPIVRGAPASGEEPEEIVPLVGVGAENLARALRVWRRAQRGEAGVVVFRGDPGTGKSRLADEVAARARLSGAVVALARGLEGDAPGDIWLALFRGGLDVPELGGAAPEALAALAAVDPDLRHRFPKAGGTALPLSDAFRHVLWAIADARPVLVVLDDAHRVDPSVLALVSSIIQRFENAPICILLTAPHVSEAMDVLCEHVGRDVVGDVIAVEPFDAAALEELVGWAFPAYDRVPRDRLVRRVLAETAGNPFLAVEFVRAVRGGLKVKADAPLDQAWPDESRTLDQTMPGDLSEAVAAALRLRFRDLSEAAQSLLRAVAVLGGASAASVLTRAAALSPEVAEKALDELEWKRWLMGDARGYTFVTKLAEEVVRTDMVTGGERRRIRERTRGQSG